MRLLPLAVFAGLMTGCGGGGGDAPANGGGNVPPEAATLEAKVRALGVKHVRKIVVLESSLVSVLVPGSPLAQGVVLTAGTAPNSYTLAGPYDGNLDGMAETQLNGSATFAMDPGIDWDGVQGQLSARVDLLNLMHVYRADVAYSVSSDERRISGTSSYSEPTGGDVTTLSVAAASPLVVKAASAGAPANVCGYNVTGEMNVAIDGVLGKYASIWRFLTGQSAVAVTGASYTANGQTTPLPDTTMDLRCGTDIADWVGTFELEWSCLPRESGNWRMRFAVKDASTLTITDVDNNDSFDAQIVGASAHALKGFFMAGPAGFTYREDFVWTLAGHRNEFTQVTKYVYQEGPKQGRGGICVGRAKRVS